jgi:hypothetical protein
LIVFANNTLFGWIIFRYIVPFYFILYRSDETIRTAEAIVIKSNANHNDYNIHHFADILMLQENKFLQLDRRMWK